MSEKFKNFENIELVDYVLDIAEDLPETWQEPIQELACRVQELEESVKAFEDSVGITAHRLKDSLEAVNVEPWDSDLERYRHGELDLLTIHELRLLAAKRILHNKEIRETRAKEREKLTEFLRSGPMEDLFP